MEVKSWKATEDRLLRQYTFEKEEIKIVVEGCMFDDDELTIRANGEDYFYEHYKPNFKDFLKATKDFSNLVGKCSDATLEIRGKSELCTVTVRITDSGVQVYTTINKTVEERDLAEKIVKLKEILEEM